MKNYLDNIVIIDDGSDDGSERIADQVASSLSGIYVIHHPSNRGKGAAVQTGLKLADELGFDDALQVDADGQHNLDDIPLFLDVRRQSPTALIMGNPVFDETIPAIRKYGRKLTTLMVMFETGSTALPDAMCGFRLYPIKAVRRLGNLSNRMSFDPEVIVRAYWTGVPIRTIVTKIQYLSTEEGEISHFKVFHDNVLNVWTHAKLLLQAPLRWYLRKRVVDFG